MTKLTAHKAKPRPPKNYFTLT